MEYVTRDMNSKKGRYQTNFLGEKIKYVILLQKAPVVIMQPWISKHCLDCSKLCAGVGNMNLLENLFQKGRTLCIFLSSTATEESFKEQ